MTGYSIKIPYIKQPTRGELNTAHLASHTSRRLGRACLRWADGNPTKFFQSQKQHPAQVLMLPDKDMRPQRIANNIQIKRGLKVVGLIHRS